ncbi:hypothetical protein JOB18_023388 [Solea senegalensis]|uniref:Uncharacterized protein n=1 Tax=Solea senegalensis TaxID=28829 RepID=A0AAV6SSP3_SOLSE|nr:hypothetical protein JOB18_023388 [Solea senegalensis]
MACRSGVADIFRVSSCVSFRMCHAGPVEPSTDCYSLTWVRWGCHEVKKETDREFFVDGPLWLLSLCLLSDESPRLLNNVDHSQVRSPRRKPKTRGIIQCKVCHNLKYLPFALTPSLSLCSHAFFCLYNNPAELQRERQVDKVQVLWGGWVQVNTESGSGSVGPVTKKPSTTRRLHLHLNCKLFLCVSETNMKEFCQQNLSLHISPPVPFCAFQVGGYRYSVDVGTPSALTPDDLPLDECDLCPRMTQCGIKPLPRASEFFSGVLVRAVVSAKTLTDKQETQSEGGRERESARERERESGGEGCVSQPHRTFQTPPPSRHVHFNEDLTSRAAQTDSKQRIYHTRSPRACFSPPICPEDR